MNKTTRIRIASLLTVTFIGGLAAVGLAVRDSGGTTTAVKTASQPRTEVVRQTEVRTVKAADSSQRAGGVAGSVAAGASTASATAAPSGAGAVSGAPSRWSDDETEHGPEREHDEVEHEDEYEHSDDDEHEAEEGHREHEDGNDD